MPLRVKQYVTVIITAAALILVSALATWSFPDPGEFTLLLGMAVFSATLKLRLPGVEGTYSLLFVFVVAAATLFSPVQTVLLASAGVLAQCVVVCSKRPTVTQILFNIAQAGVAARIAHWARTALEKAGHQGHTFEVVLVTGMVYFACNTAIVSGVMALLSTSSVIRVWTKWHLVCFPYHLLATLICAAVIAERSVVHVSDIALTVPALTMMYLFFTYRSRRLKLLSRGSKG